MLYVKLRAGQLPYKDDPQGWKSLLASTVNHRNSGFRAFKVNGWRCHIYHVSQHPSLKVYLVSIKLSDVGNYANSESAYRLKGGGFAGERLVAGHSPKQLHGAAAQWAHELQGEAWGRVHCKPGCVQLLGPRHADSWQHRLVLGWEGTGDSV